jgi:hypothetical protein
MSNSNSNMYIPFGWAGYIPYPTQIELDESDAAIAKDDRDGCVCKSCKDFYQYAVANQDDKSFICYGCRHGY